MDLIFLVLKGKSKGKVNNTIILKSNKQIKFKRNPEKTCENKNVCNEKTLVPQILTV